MRSTKQCSELNQAGQPCKAIPGANGKCVFHSSEHAAAVVAGRRMGAGRPMPPPGTEPQIHNIDDVLTLINKILAEAWYYRRSPTDSRVLLAAAEAASRALETADLEQRISALEEIQYTIDGGRDEKWQR